jgi:hypothetical protein
MFDFTSARCLQVRMIDFDYLSMAVLLCTFVTDPWSKYEKKGPYRGSEIKCDLNWASESFQNLISRERFNRLS